MKSLTVYRLSETVVNSAGNATELHVDKQLPLFPSSLQTGAGISAVGRSRVLRWWLWPCELGPRHPQRSSMARCPIPCFGQRWISLIRRRASSRPLDLYQPVDCSELLLMG